MERVPILFSSSHLLWQSVVNLYNVDVMSKNFQFLAGMMNLLVLLARVRARPTVSWVRVAGRYPMYIQYASLSVRELKWLDVCWLHTRKSQYIAEY